MCTKRINPVASGRDWKTENPKNMTPSYKKNIMTVLSFMRYVNAKNIAQLSDFQFCGKSLTGDEPIHFLPARYSGEIFVYPFVD